MSIVKILFFTLTVTAATPAFADEPPSDNGGGGCTSGQTELGLGLLSALGIMRRRSVTRDEPRGTARGPGARA